MKQDVIFKNIEDDLENIPLDGYATKEEYDKIVEFRSRKHEAEETIIDKEFNDVKVVLRKAKLIEICNELNISFQRIKELNKWYLKYFVYQENKGE